MQHINNANVLRLLEFKVKFVITKYYANTFFKDIRINCAIKEICRRLQTIQAIT